MRKLFLFLIAFLFLSKINNAQVLSDSLKTQIDSMAILNDLISLLDSADKPKSYVNIELGIGNRLFSVRNNALNSKQQSVRTLIWSPSVGYFHKSGFSISAGANLLHDTAYGKGFGVNQWSVSPGYELQGNDNIAFSFSYAHYFVKDKYSPYSSPIQNDWYTFFSYKKTWLQPGIALGLSTGEYKQVIFKDSSNGTSTKRLYDSITYSPTIFSVIASVGHQFEWYKLFSKKDGLVVNTSLLLNMGSDKSTIAHKTNAIHLYNRLTKNGKLPKVANNQFSAESVGLNVSLNYAIGKLNFAPQLYLDYYLPKTDGQQFTSLFSFNISFSL
jgi:hypothetical protein